MDKNYVLQTDINPNFALCNFNWQSTVKSSVLTWDWPSDREIRFAIVFNCTEEIGESPDIAKLLSDKHPHDVVMRDLASSYETIISEGRRKFVVCPARFCSDKSIGLCPPALTTDWIYKKTGIIAKTTYNPLHLSQYQKAELNFTISNESVIPINILSYVLQESGKEIARYPLDSQLILNGGSLYIAKNQTIEYVLHPDHEHLYELNQ